MAARHGGIVRCRRTLAPAGTALPGALIIVTTGAMAGDSTPSRALPLLTALTGGVLLALALQISLTARGLQIADVFSDVLAGNPVRLRAAMVWWVIAGSALVTGALVSWALAHFAPPWHSYRGLRWIIGAIIVFALAHIGHGAELPHGVSPVVYLMASAAAVVVAAVMALIGAVFALRG